MGTPTRPLVQAHRGGAAMHPENTIAAFRAAADAGFDGIELDVRLSHDGEVVCLHDANLARTTDGQGRAQDLDYDELAAFDTGAGPVPRLVDALAALSDWKGLWNIEIKDPDAGPHVLDIIEHAGVTDRTLLSSFDPDALERTVDVLVQRGLITFGPPDDTDLQGAHEVDCAWINVDHDYLNTESIAAIHAKGFKVGAWTVNDPDRAVELVGLGVDAIITDTEDVLKALRAVA